VVRCQVGSHVIVQAAEQTAHPKCGPRRRPGTTSDRRTQIGEQPVKVTSADITAGRAGHQTLDPIGFAIARATGRTAVVMSHAIRVGGVDFRTPRSVRRFIRAFDSGDNVAPFGFRLKEIGR